MKNYTMRKLFTISLFIFGFLAINLQAQTYSWNRTDSADFQVATNWTPSRTVPSATDVLVFNNGATGTIAYNVPTQTIARFLVESLTTVRIYSAAAITLTITGGSAPNFEVEAGSSLTASASATANAIVINLTTGTTGLIGGTFAMLSSTGTTNHRLQAADAGAIIFSSTGVSIFGPNVQGNPFGGGTAPSALNSVIFQSGSRYIARGGSNPFGAGQPSSVCTFQTGSTFDCQITGPAFSGRTYANYEQNIAGAVTATGGATSTVDNITVNLGTFNYNMTGRSNIKGNITVAAGQTMNIAPASNPSDSLVFNGTTEQSINGAGTFNITNTATIQNKVVLNNSAGLVLNKNVTIPGTLIMLSGNITTGANTLTLGTSATILGTLVRTSGTVIGTMARWFTTGTVTDVVYPLGTATNYRPFTLSYTSGPVAAGTVTIGHVDGVDGSDIAAPILDGAFLINRNSNMYWTIAFAGAFGGTMSFSINGNGQNGINDPGNLRAIYSSDGTVFLALGNHQSGSTTVARRTEVPGGTPGRFYLGGNTTNNPLPVELDNFVATTIKNEVILDWYTGHEINNSGFELERAKLTEKEYRTDADLNFERVAFVQSKGNSNLVQGYKYIDGNLSMGRFAYRLKQIDFNGNHTYFLLNNEVVVSNPNKFTINQNYPNPFNPTTNISFDMPFDGIVSLIVFDNLGREVKTLVNGNVNSGYHRVEFNASGLPSGMYFYRINAASGTEKFEKVFKMMLVK